MWGGLSDTCRTLQGLSNACRGHPDVCTGSVMHVGDLLMHGDMCCRFGGESMGWMWVVGIIVSGGGLENGVVTWPQLPCIWCPVVFNFLVSQYIYIDLHLITTDA